MGQNFFNCSYFASKCNVVVYKFTDTDITGNSGSAFVEVLVRDSLEGIYVSLLPQSMLMSAEESKSGRNLSRTKHFSTGKGVEISIQLLCTCDSFNDEFCFCCLFNGFI